MKKTTLTLFPRSAELPHLRVRDASFVVEEFYLALNLMNSNDFMDQVRQKLTLSLIGLVQRETSIAYRRGYHDAWKDHERLHSDDHNTNVTE